MSTSASPLSRFCSIPLSVLLDRISARLRLALPADDQTQAPSLSHPHLSRFQAHCLPTITIQAYLTRLVTLSPISVDALLLALLYLHRAIDLPLIPSSAIFQFSPKQAAFPTVPYHLLTVHRLLLSSLIIANKFISDHFVAASRASKVGGIPIDELAAIERGLLECLGFRLNFTLPELDHVALWVLEDHPTPSSSVLPELQSVDQLASSLTQQAIIEPATGLPIPSVPQCQLDPPLLRPTPRTQSTPDPVAGDGPKPRRGRVFLRTHFVCDPDLNSNYLSRRPVTKCEELEGATRIIITTLDKHVLKVRTDLIGFDAHTGEKVCRTTSSRSYNHSLPVRNISPA